MTPLARVIAKQNLEPRSRRPEGDECDLYKKMDDIHCFDVTQVLDLVEDLAWKIVIGETCIGELSFLPARKTWIEWSRTSNFPQPTHYLPGLHCSPVGRDCTQGTLLVGATGKDDVTVFEAQACGPLYNAWTGDFGLRLNSSERPQDYFGLTWAGKESIAKCETFTQGNILHDDAKWYAAMLMASLALINSPKVIGRRTHAPHRGLERDLIQRRAVVGRFPLRAWTEIILAVGPPTAAADDAPDETHLTGNRCLHFVRRHVRVIGGRVTYVREHWRGDAALGIKRSRYIMKPEGRLQ